MNSKEFLMQVKDKEIAITNKEEYIQRLKDSLELSGITYDSDKIQTSPDPDRFASVFAKIDEAEKELERMRDDYIQFRIKVIDMIAEIPELIYRQILLYVYLDGMNLKQCAECMNYSYNYVREQHIKALTNIKPT